MQKFGAEGIGEAADRELGAAIRRLNGDGPIGKRRAERHNRAPVSGNHALQCRHRAVDGSPVGDLCRPLELLDGDLGERSEDGSHGIVDHTSIAPNRSSTASAAASTCSGLTTLVGRARACPPSVPPRPRPRPAPLGRAPEAQCWLRLERRLRRSRGPPPRMLRRRQRPVLSFHPSSALAWWGSDRCCISVVPVVISPAVRAVSREGWPSVSSLRTLASSQRGRSVSAAPKHRSDSR
jgi:hypothetical protein